MAALLVSKEACQSPLQPADQAYLHLLSFTLHLQCPSMVYTATKLSEAYIFWEREGTSSAWSTVWTEASTIKPSVTTIYDLMLATHQGPPNSFICWISLTRLVSSRDMVFRNFHWDCMLRSWQIEYSEIHTRVSCSWLNKLKKKRLDKGWGDITESNTVTVFMIGNWKSCKWQPC